MRRPTSRVLPALVLAAAAPAGALGAASYSVSATRLKNTPLLAYENGTSEFRYVYNAALIPDLDGNIHILARCQDVTDPKNPYSTNASVLALTRFNSSDFTSAEPVLRRNVVFAPVGTDDECGTEDPRVSVGPSGHPEELYLFYTSWPQKDAKLGCGTPHLSLAVSRGSIRNFTRIPPTVLFPGMESKSGSPIWGAPPARPHMLAFGDGTIHKAWSNDPAGLKWSYNSSEAPFLAPRAGSFDSNLVEGGPPPLALSDGNVRSGPGAGVELGASRDTALSV
jgi:predicted GH43/DUF377 family glycosyl hydrolase